MIEKLKTALVYANQLCGERAEKVQNILESCIHELTPNDSTWNDAYTVPKVVGEYEASCARVEGILRYWNGSQWSEPYSALMERNKKNKLMNEFDNTLKSIYWRKVN